jgi:hypothetical protein
MTWMISFVRISKIIEQPYLLVRLLKGSLRLEINFSIARGI